MNDKRIFVFSHMTARKLAAAYCMTAPDGYVCTIQEKTRTLEQNSKLWPMLGDVSKQVEWYGQYLSDEEWKDVFTAALKRQKVVPGIDGGFVVCGQRTSKMGKKEFSELIELIYAFGTERNVKWSEDDPQRTQSTI